MKALLSVALAITAGVLSSCSCPGGSQKCRNYFVAAVEPPRPRPVIADTPERAECQLAAALPQPTSPGQNPLPVTPRCQEGMYSCWATCAEMIMEFTGGARVRQCDQATDVFQHYGCCGGNGVLLSGDCDFPWAPQFARWGYDYYHSESPLDWAQVQGEIAAGQPFAFALTRLSNITAGTPLATGVQPVPAVSHMFVGIGHRKHPASGVDVIIALDPSPVRQTQPVMLPFTDYQGVTGHHAHAEDYWGIQPQSAP